VDEVNGHQSMSLVLCYLCTWLSILIISDGFYFLILVKMYLINVSSVFLSPSHLLTVFLNILKFISASAN